MSTHSINETNVPAQEFANEPKSSVQRGTLVGLIPLGLLAGIVAITLLVTALARQVVGDAGFFAQQQAALIALIVGLFVSIVVFAVAIWRVLRRVAAWQQDGTATQANAALWTLGASALIVVVPILLALLLPQYPAP